MIQKERKFKSRYQNLIAKKHTHSCSHPQCQDKSIGSHTISRKSFLNLISSDGHVVSNNFDIIGGALKSKEDILNPSNKINFKFKDNKGIGEASTFKGFCNKHDTELFKSIDEDGITKVKDVYLQLYRTLTKYYFIDNMVSQAELEVLKREVDSNQVFEDNKVFNLEDLKLLFEKILLSQELIEDLNETIVLEDNQFIYFKPFSLPVIIYYERVNLLFPMALEKKLTIYTKYESSDSLFVLLPNKNYTDIIILFHEDIFSEYNQYLQVHKVEQPSIRKIGILNLVEILFMTDANFYLNPEYFKMWSKKKVNILEQDFYFFQERKFLEEYEVSIFDDIREEICKELPDDMKKHEMKKIGYIPHRPSIEDRIINMRMLTDLNRMKKNAYTSE